MKISDLIINDYNKNEKEINKNDINEINNIENNLKTKKIEIKTNEYDDQNHINLICFLLLIFGFCFPLFWLFSYLFFTFNNGYINRSAKLMVNISCFLFVLTLLPNIIVFLIIIIGIIFVFQK